MATINFKHKNDIDLFVKDNIELINTRISDFRKSNYITVGRKDADTLFNDTAIKRHLNQKFYAYIMVQENRSKLLEELEKENFVKNRIPQIATRMGFYKKDLENFFVTVIFEELADIDVEESSHYVAETIMSKKGFSKQKIKFFKSQLTSVIEKSLYIALKNGFAYNLHNAEEGIMTANAGDSAQFLFLARAILAGYNCSNVDVRSSRYDAVIDQNGYLYRIQIKGISDNNVSFKDRDRGGEGIDHTNDKNKGKRITSADCDLFVAVDKQIGICYIIPIKDVEALNVDNVNIKDIAKYKENWNMIDNLKPRKD